jgi:hypothetical protein
MFILKYIDEDDNLATKEFEALSDLKSYVEKNNFEKIWHQVEEIKKVIPNLKEE